MENKTLKNLFDFQKFNENPLLEDLIADTEQRYSLNTASPKAFEELSDDRLNMINAAGGPIPRGVNKEKL